MNLMEATHHLEHFNSKCLHPLQFYFLNCYNSLKIILPLLKCFHSYWLDFSAHSSSVKLNHLLLFNWWNYKEWKLTELFLDILRVLDSLPEIEVLNLFGTFFLPSSSNLGVSKYSNIFSFYFKSGELEVFNSLFPLSFLYSLSY